MTKHDTGGPAFPVIERDLGLPEGNGGVEYTNPGMTLLDWFAGQALAGLEASPGMVDRTVDQDVEMAYALADAMLAEKRRREGKAQ